MVPPGLAALWQSQVGRFGLLRTKGQVFLLCINASKAETKKDAVAEPISSLNFSRLDQSDRQSIDCSRYILDPAAYLPAACLSSGILMPFARRLYFDWRLRTRTLELGPRTLIMGILNVTPDSFSDGGQFLDVVAARNHALAMLDDGADILDLGGESTRPNAVPVTPAEEQARVLPVLHAILQARPAAIVSIDTYHAETAHRAVEAGAEIVNDVSGHLWDPAMSNACAALKCGAILMHTRGRPHEWRTLPSLEPGEVLPLVLGDLKACAQAALDAGIARESIVLDPGFGFGKALNENYPLLAHLDQLHTLGLPILAGVSRKSFLTRAASSVPRPATNPGAPQLALSLPKGLASDMWESSHQLLTSVANTAAILAGAHILRVHDVRPARAAAAIADRILAS
jgi:dihydropteroate synthase